MLSLSGRYPYILFSNRPTSSSRYFHSVVLPSPALTLMPPPYLPDNINQFTSFHIRYQQGDGLSSDHIQSIGDGLNAVHSFQPIGADLLGERNSTCEFSGWGYFAVMVVATTQHKQVNKKLKNQQR